MTRNGRDIVLVFFGFRERERERDMTEFGFQLDMSVTAVDFHSVLFGFFHSSIFNLKIIHLKFQWVDFTVYTNKCLVFDGLHGNGSTPSLLYRMERIQMLTVFFILFLNIVKFIIGFDPLINNYMK
jgi:hypothetical protein